MDKSKFKLPSKLIDCAENVWIEFSTLSAKCNAVNISQGAPDYSAPEIVTDALEKVSKVHERWMHQYPRGFGHLRLTKAISKVYSPFLNRELNPEEEILITNGATQALYYALMGFVEPGDEVIIIEPFFDCFELQTKMTGAILRYLSLRPDPNSRSSADWVFDETELEQLFNEKTKAIIVNTPNNPTGKVYSLKELKIIADLCIRWNVLCISDEVYEWIVYPPDKHERIATLPGMWERTITIGSAGKTFSATGWKIGWLYCPAYLMHNLKVVHQNCVYNCNTPLQEGIALAFEEYLNPKNPNAPDDYFETLSPVLQKKRDFCAKFLSELGLEPVVPQGGYFMVLNWSSLASKVNLENESDKYQDYKFAKWICKNLGISVIPCTVFYSKAHKHLAEKYVRICFIKEDKTLEKASNILKTWFKTA